MQDVGRRWLEQAAGDPKLQARIAEPLVRGSIANADLESAEAMAWGLLDNVSEPDALAPVFDRVVRAATSRDSARGAAVVERLPAGEMRDGILPTFTRQWAELDPAAAADWLAEQPAGAGRDRATRELVACSRDDPESALANAAGIADPKLRLQAARSVLQVWRDVDPAQVAGILPGAGFPPEELPMLRALLGLAPDTAKTPGR